MADALDVLDSWWDYITGESDEFLLLSDLLTDEGQHTNVDRRHFDVLGVKPGEPWESIRRAYRQKVKMFHPDRETGDRNVFLRVQEAYEYMCGIYNKTK